MSSKIPEIIVTNVEKLVQQMVPTISQIVEKTGIQNIGQPNMQMPGECLLQNDLQEILRLRNTLINKLNTTSKTIETLSKSLNPLTQTVDISNKSLDIAKIALTTAETAMIITPPAIPIPGSVITGYVKVNNLVNTTIPPIITLASNKITSIKEALDYANSTIFKLLNTIKSIDQYLTGCGVSVIDSPIINNYINQINQQYTDTKSNVYKGFTLEIIEESYSPTVNRRKAVAKNKDGIILLSTPLSFTTLSQVLIQELKLLIDTNNLKAD